MFAGKTTELIRRFQCARDVGESTLLVKSTGDTRYAAGQVQTHPEAASNVAGLPAVELDRLALVDYSTISTLCIDELHFFPDALVECAKLQGLGIQVVATTLDVDGEGNDFMLSKLTSAGVEVQPVHLTGRCAFPGCSDPSCRTSRLTPVGSNWLGGAEHYQPHCLFHHA